MSSAKLPQVGLGTFQDTEADVSLIVYEALKLGYRQIDTALIYDNEEGIGIGIQKAISEGILKREELFVVTKLPSFGHRRVLHYLKKSLASLQLDYVDLYLIHTPMYILEEAGLKNRFALSPFDPEANHVATWKEMEEAVDAGLTRHIGLSNFNSIQIKKVYEAARIKPFNLQVECHAYLPQKELFEFCKSLNITFTAYAPIGAFFLPSFIENITGKEVKYPILLEEPILATIGKQHSKSPAQVLLRWLMQRGINVIPKTKNLPRLKENFEVFDFELTPEEMHQISSLDRQLRFFSFDFIKEVLDHPEYPFHIKY